MSDTRRVTGERVFCHQCNHEWDRALGGLTCPRCEGEFVEVLEPGTTTLVRDESPVRPPSEPRSLPFPSPFSRQPAQPSPFHDHNPWRDAPDPDEADITTYQFNTGRGRGTISFTTSTSFNSRSSPAPRPQSIFGSSPFGFANNNPPPGNGFSREYQTNGGFTREFHGQVGPGNMQDIFSLIFQTMQHGGMAQPQQRQADDGNRPPNPFELLGALLNPGNARAGDHVWSQEAFDRIVEQLAEQNAGSTAPGPASETAIAALPSKKVDAAMLGDDGKAECSICMDSVQLGTEVTILPCTHWFHGACVTAWLKEHDTCPHCRSPITRPEDTNNNSSSRPGGRRRRSSRRSSSVASPFGAANNPIVVPDSPSGLREARQQYYGSRQDSDAERSRNNRPGSTHSDQNTNSRSNNSGGGIAGTVSQWLRDRMNPGGS